MEAARNSVSRSDEHQATSVGNTETTTAGGSLGGGEPRLPKGPTVDRFGGDGSSPSLRCEFWIGLSHIHGPDNQIVELTESRKMKFTGILLSHLSTCAFKGLPAEFRLLSNPVSDPAPTPELPLCASKVLLEMNVTLPVGESDFSKFVDVAGLYRLIDEIPDFKQVGVLLMALQKAGVDITHPNPGMGDQVSTEERAKLKEMRVEIFRHYIEAISDGEYTGDENGKVAFPRSVGLAPKDSQSTEYHMYRKRLESALGPEPTEEVAKVAWNRRANDIERYEQMKDIFERVQRGEADQFTLAQCNHAMSVFKHEFPGGIARLALGIDDATLGVSLIEIATRQYSLESQEIKQAAPWYRSPASTWSRAVMGLEGLIPRQLYAVAVGLGSSVFASLSLSEINALTGIDVRSMNLFGHTLPTSLILGAAVGAAGCGYELLKAGKNALRLFSQAEHERLDKIMERSKGRTIFHAIGALRSMSKSIEDSCDSGAESDLQRPSHADLRIKEIEDSRKRVGSVSGMTAREKAFFVNELIAYAEAKGMSESDVLKARNVRGDFLFDGFYGDVINNISFRKRDLPHQMRVAAANYGGSFAGNEQRIIDEKATSVAAGLLREHTDKTLKIRHPTLTFAQWLAEKVEATWIGKAWQAIDPFY